MKVHIVCLKEWGHAPKIMDKSKAFQDKEMADYFAKELTNDLVPGWDSGNQYLVKTMEVVEDR